MENDVDGPLDLEMLADVLLLEAEIRVRLQVLDIGRVARDEIVNADDTVALHQ